MLSSRANIWNQALNCRSELAGAGPHGCVGWPCGGCPAPYQCIHVLIGVQVSRRRVIWEPLWHKALVCSPAPEPGQVSPSPSPAAALGLLCAPPSNSGMRCDHHPLACPRSIQHLCGRFLCQHHLAQAWVDEMDFAVQNPLISSILNCISQITGVRDTVIALSGGHAPHFMPGGNALSIASLPPISTELQWSCDKDVLNTPRNVTSRVQHRLPMLTCQPGRAAGIGRGVLSSSPS